MKPAIEIKGLSKKYRKGSYAPYLTLRDSLVSMFSGKKSESLSKDEFWALKDINLEIMPGEVVGVIGRNGAGKSTLLKILSRITHPTQGEVILRGRVGSLLEVGTGFHQELSGRENIYLNGAVLGMTRGEISKKFNEIVEFSEIGKFVDTPVKHYSSGMYMRLAFSVAAHLESEILLVDEVLAVGDFQFQEKCLGKMESLTRNEGRTILFVSHNMSAIKSLCSKAILLENGRISSKGKLSQVINDYISSVGLRSIVDLTKSAHDNKPREFGKLTKLIINNSMNQPSNTFRMGDTIKFRISFECHKPTPNVEVGIKISSALGVAINYFPSTWEGIQLNCQKGQYTFEISVPNVLLFPGKYLISAWLLKVGQPSDDSIQDISMIEILSSDITGYSANFEQYAYSGSEIYVPSKWKRIE